MAAALVLSGCSRGGSTLRVYQTGEKAEVGHFIYTIFEAQWLTQIGVGPGARVPQHRFLMLRINAVNSGGGDLMMPAVTLVDDSGTRYPEMTDGEGVPLWLGLLRQVRPGEAAQGNLAYDVPPAHYKVRLTDENEQRAAYVDLPLNFSSGTP